jgi:hypothetical protein
MEPRKLNVMVATYSYGGNGGMKSEHPDVGRYLIRLKEVLRSDPRIGETFLIDYADTPITMTRNRSVVDARKHGADLLMMVDSDMAPDAFMCRNGAQPFFQSSFDFIYRHYDKGPVVVGAPYCGPPPDEVVYIFRWKNHATNEPGDIDMELEMFSREDAAFRGGIQEVAALPTGLILWDMRCFELTEPTDKSEQSWFYYEWTNKYQSEKASTEDVTATRDVSLAGVAALGYNPVYCNWDAWAGHWKPKCVTPPQLLTASMVGSKLARAARERPGSDEQIVSVTSSFADTIDWDLAAVDTSRVPRTAAEAAASMCGGLVCSNQKANGQRETVELSPLENEVVQDIVRNSLRDLMAARQKENGHAALRE